jgi:release factor glutamine methyltransferase
MQLRESLAAAIVRLALAHVPSPRLNAELLLMFTLSCDRAYLFAHPERELTPDERSRYESSLTKRGHGIPAQYITGHQEFWGMDLIVSPAVLIPRPETEHIIEAVLELRKADVGLQTSDLNNPTSDVRRPRSALRIADIGTGSGAIALALAKEFPHAEIHATDISTPALEIAGANAARLQLANRIQFHQTDLLAGLTPPFDLIVSNPPYVGEFEEDQVQLEVRKFEPRNAVFAGPTGIEVIERLIPQARAALKPGGWLVMEISGSIAERVRELLKGWNEVEIKPDLQSIPRVAQARNSLPPIHTDQHG